MTDTKWAADPKRGADQLEPRRAEIVAALENAADVAFFAIEQQLDADIAALRKAAGEKKANIVRSVEKARTDPAMMVVRKFWNETPDQMWRHFVHNMADNSGKP